MCGGLRCKVCLSTLCCLERCSSEVQEKYSGEKNNPSHSSSASSLRSVWRLHCHSRQPTHPCWCVPFPPSLCLLVFVLTIYLTCSKSRSNHSHLPSAFSSLFSSFPPSHILSLRVNTWHLTPSFPCAVQLLERRLESIEM